MAGSSARAGGCTLSCMGMAVWEDGVPWTGGGGDTGDSTMDMALGHWSCSGTGDANHCGSGPRHGAEVAMWSQCMR